MIMIMNQVTCHPKPQVPPARVGSGEEPAAGGPAAAAHAAAPPTAAAPAAPPPAVPPVPAPPGPDDYPARPQVCPTTHTALFPSLLLLLLWRSSLSPFSLPLLVSTASLSSLSPVSRLPSLLSACSTTHSLSREEGSLSSPLSCSCSSCAPPSPLPPCLSHGSFSALARLFLRLYPRLPDLSPAPLLMCGRLLKRFQHRHRHQLVVLAMEVYELTNLGGCIHASLTTHLHPCLCVGG